MEYIRNFNMGEKLMWVQVVLRQANATALVEQTWKIIHLTRSSITLFLFASFSTSDIQT